jgi:hypothetical protein
MVIGCMILYIGLQAEPFTYIDHKWCIMVKEGLREDISQMREKVGHSWDRVIF